MPHLHHVALSSKGIMYGALYLDDLTILLYRKDGVKPKIKQRYLYLVSYLDILPGCPALLGCWGLAVPLDCILID